MDEKAMEWLLVVQGRLQRDLCDCCKCLFESVAKVRFKKRSCGYCSVRCWSKASARESSILSRVILWWMSVSSLGRLARQLRYFTSLLAQLVIPVGLQEPDHQVLRARSSLSEAEQFFAEMCSKKFFLPDVPTYRTMMDAYVKRVESVDAVKNCEPNIGCLFKLFAKKVIVV
ncbi:Uncharacterized protein Rs2_51307 [Raphanus sativus]|nr:Uncharacterized protein Rs2_51307 [Raphanus sativus]